MPSSIQRADGNRVVGRVRSARRPLAAAVAAGIALVLAPSCVITSGLHVVATLNVTPPPNSGVVFAGNSLRAVAGVAPNDVWAAGQFSFWAGQGIALPRPLMMHWDGKSWRMVSVPEPGGMLEYVSDVVAVSSRDVWAAGEYRKDFNDQTSRPLVLHFDGKRWTQVKVPQPAFGGPDRDSGADVE